MRKKNKAVLGIFVTDSSVEGVLLARDDNEGVQFIDRFAKPRARRGESVLSSGSLLPGLKDRSESDYTMEVGDGSQHGADLFMAREFGGAATATAEKVRTDTQSTKTTTPFGPQVKDILSQCREVGHPDPIIAFVVGATDLSYHEVGLQTKEAKKERTDRAARKLARDEKKALLANLDEIIQGDVDKKRTAFVLMAPRTGRRRFLAIVPSKPDAVSTALDTLARTSKNSVPTTSVVDSEISILLSIVKRQEEDIKGNTAIVRVSSTDTTVLFLKDGELDRYEYLRSLTSYDSIDTVCSRVALKQDELRIGRLDQVFVSSEHQGTNTLEGFADFFPESKVFALGDLLEEEGLNKDKVSELRAASIPAAAVALRVIQNWDRDTRSGTAINLLEKKRRGTALKRDSMFVWHSAVLMIALFGASLYFTWAYMQNQAEIDLRNEEIRLNPPQFPTEDPVLLRARVDSLQRVYQNHTRAMFVLDSLLTGSDKWSSTLDEFTQSTRSINRIWFKAWTPSGNTVRLEGNALERNRIASLAQDWNGSIEKLNFAEIQGMRVYSFTMSIPVESKLPEIVGHLRNATMDGLDADEAEALSSMANASHTHENE